MVPKTIEIAGTLIPLEALNGMTKLGKFPRVHERGKGGRAAEEVSDKLPVLADDDELSVTEKIDGAKVRISHLPQGSERRYIVGPAEQLIYAESDLLTSDTNGLLTPVAPLIERHFAAEGNILVLFGESYGGKIQAKVAQNYTGGQEDLYGFRLFASMHLPAARVQERAMAGLSSIAQWREETMLKRFDTLEESKGLGIEMVAVNSAVTYATFMERTKRLPETASFLRGAIPMSEAKLSAGASGVPEGAVLRTSEGGMFCKLHHKA